ncbi:tumor protein p53-inducible nuclear protein 1 [Antennarius striatus]|uniref:tumor protein p53-inducible nuclear protein 1 n=1 Tax=Antennarius striatus TaxID=241820 RepID=UPI0035B0CC9F
MFQRFASALFGDDVEPLSGGPRPGDKEEEEDWILVNYLAEACADGPEGEEEEEEEEPVVIPSPVGPRFRYASCTSLDSTADTDLAEEEEEVEGGFLQVDAGSLEESWFVTPPPCFTGRSVHPVLLEPSPLENLLIEHPSMSVYAHHGPPRLSLDPLPCSLELPPTPAAGGKEKGRRAADGPRLRPDGAVAPRRSSISPACYAAALTAHTGLLQPRPGGPAQNAQPSRKALRRLNMLRPPKAGAAHLHQPSQKHLNF